MYNYKNIEKCGCFCREKEDEMKKIVSVLLLLGLLLSPMPLSALAADGCTCGHTPIIYVRGRSDIVADKSRPVNAETNPALPDTKSIDAVELIKQVVPLYCMNYLKNDFSEFTQFVCDWADDMFGEFRPDNSGNIVNNSGIVKALRWRENRLTDKHKPSSAVTTPQQASAELYKYDFHYDYRLDPLDTADDLRDYVEAVKAVTGHNKVKFISRCNGCIVLLCYLNQYGWDDVESLVFYNSIARGTAATDSVFTGHILLDAQGTDYFAQQMLGDEPVYALVKDLVSLAKLTRLLDLLFAYYNKTLPRIGREVLPEGLRHSLATCPGFWAMVAADHYDAARALVFGGHEAEYAELLEKIDRYHEQVGSHIDDILLQLKADGVPVSFITKYGFQLYPVTEQADRQSDTIVTVEQQSPGTTSAPMGQTFSEDYREEQERLGNSAYLSPDLSINAATAMFPDTSWYIKDLTHDYFPSSVDMLIYRFLTGNGEMTVFTDEAFPQFLQYSEEGCAPKAGFLVPVTAQDTPNSVSSDGFFSLQVDLFRQLFLLIKQAISSNDE